VLRIHVYIEFGAGQADLAFAGQDDGFDWSSVEQVTALVSKTTLAGLQQQWKQHAASMDQFGRSFAESMFNYHSQVIKVGRYAVP
jgi:hypothetical protein